MKTKQWMIDPLSVTATDPAIKAAADDILAGGNIAFPTETVYGLGADASNTTAVERIFKAKGRPNDNPLIVHIADIAQLDGVVDTSHPWIQQLMAHFWPGPLTLVLPVTSDIVSPSVTAGLNTLAVRMPDHPIALALIRATRCLIAAPSANRSGRPSPTRAGHVMDDLGGKIDGVIDGGPTGVGLESTVVTIVEERIRILRPGAISLSKLQEAIQGAAFDVSTTTVDEKTPRSPGLKYAHYAPKGKMTLVKGQSFEHVRQWIQQSCKAASLRGERTGILTYAEHVDYYEADVVLSCGQLAKPEETAQKLYDVLRAFDQEQVSYILAEACSEIGIGAAVMNRLEKAAGHNVVHL